MPTTSRRIAASLGLVLLTAWTPGLAAEPATPADARAPLDEQLAAIQVVVRQAWDQTIAWLETDAERSTEAEARDAYLALVAAIRAGDDPGLKRRLIRYEYRFGLAAAISDSTWAEDAAAMQEARERVARYRKLLAEFEAAHGGRNPGAPED